MNGETVTLICPTFLNVFISKIVYGRNKGKELCNGEKPKDSFQPTGDVSCFNPTKSEEVANEFRTACHGGFNCSHDVPTLILDAACDGMKREMTLEYNCGKSDFNLIF